MAFQSDFPRKKSGWLTATQKSIRSLWEKRSKEHCLSGSKMNTTLPLQMKPIQNISKAVKRVHLLPNFGKSAVYEL